MTSPLRSEDGVREMVMVVDVTSSSVTRRGNGDGGADNKTLTRNDHFGIKESKR